MAKQRKLTSTSSSSSIITIDPYSNTSYRFSANEMIENDLGRSSFKKNNFFISYVMTKDIVFGTIEISRSIPESDLKDALEIKAYEDLGLDSSINYKINYLETASSSSDQKNYIYDVFAVNSEAIAQSFNAIKRKLPFVDYITTAPLLIGALYKKGIIDQRSGAECFIYFQKNDAFLAIYQNGRYLYSKSLRYSLREINERFCSLIGERIDEDRFFEMLKKDGLNTTDVKYQQHFMKLFGEVFLYINDISVYGKRYCNISQIDRVYIGTEIGTIIGMNEYAKSYMGLESHNFNFSIAINAQNKYIDQIHVMMILAAQLYRESKGEDSFNFTVFKRPDPLSQRPVGTFLTAIAAGLILSLLYPAYNYGFGAYKLTMFGLKNSEYTNTVKPEADRIRAELAILVQQYTELSGTLNQELGILNTRSGLLQEIRDKRKHYAMRATTIADLIAMSNKNNVKVDKITQNKDNIVLSLVGTNEKHITELIDEIAGTERYAIRTKVIAKNSNTSKYESNISMEILNVRE